ncbi:MAG: ABC transporter substrate-binding protein [Pyrinomonadaceae bacterium]|nr:ABC transporter substrate-binding protein [Pyrinomonadaceae bacterium]
MTRNLLFPFAVFFLAVVLSTVHADGQEPQRGGSVVVAVTMDPGGLNPAVTTQAAVHLVCGSVFSGLVAQDFELNPVPDLATRWEVSNDGKTYTFYLAENAEFHDGVALTSADVKYTFEELLLKFHSRTRASIGDKLRQIITPDAHTVVFEFNAPYAAFLQLIDVTNAPIMPKHLYENTDPLTNSYNVKPVGSGAFKFQEWAKGDHLTLVKNERYFKTGKPYLDRIVYKVMPSIATAAIAFENGEADYFLNPAPLDIERLKKLRNVVVTGKGREGFASVETLIFNLNRAPLSDVRVRQAMAHTIDRNYIVDKIAFGMGIAATGPISTALKWAYNPNVVKYERNISLANQMLDEAGYKRSGDGVRFRLKYVYAASYAKVVEALRDQLREVGIAIDLEQMEFNAAVERTYIKKDFDLGISSFENGPDPDIGVKRTVVSSNIGAIPFSNGAGYRNPRIDELFELAASETDRQKRAVYYYEAQEILTKDAPYLWLYELQGAAVYKSELQGIYGWSAKSSVYFAQDAWWINGKSSNGSASDAFGQRRLYFFLIIGAIFLIAAIVTLSKRRKHRS